MDIFKILNVEWETHKQLFERMEITAKTVLLHEGQVAKKLFMVEKGCLRSWFNNNGKDVTFQFFFEGQTVSSIESFMTGNASLFTIESIEPCVVYSISKHDFETMKTLPLVKQYFDELIFQRLIFYQRLFLSRIIDNPEKRYKELLAHHPEIIQRVPQHYIASYLGITSVSLSRIRNRR